MAAKFGVMRSNCIVVAVTAILRARRRGTSRPGAEVHAWGRWSRAEWGFFHLGWQKNDPLTGKLAWRRSFKPTAPVDAPWYLCWGRLRFDGRIERDDKFTPKTKEFTI